MTILTPHISPNQYPTGPTSFMTERNSQEVRCGICARVSYVNRETYSFVRAAIEAGYDNPFRCEICVESYDQLDLLGH